MYGDQFGEFVCGYWGLKGYRGVSTRRELTAICRCFLKPCLNWQNPSLCSYDFSQKFFFVKWKCYQQICKSSPRFLHILVPQDEVVAANCLSFNLDGSCIYCGFNKMVRIFDTARPGRDFQERPTTGTSIFTCSRHSDSEE